MRRRVPLSSCRLLVAPYARSFFGPFKKKPEGESGKDADPMKGFPFPMPGADGKMPGMPEGFLKALQQAKETRGQREPPQWMQKWAAKNVEMIQKSMEVNKKLGEQATQSGNPTIGKLFGKNADFVEKMITAQEKIVNQGKKARGEPVNEKEKGKSVQSTSVNSSDEGTSDNVDLGPEIEELFAELRLMRKKRNEAKEALKLKTEEAELAKRDLTKIKNVEADLRDRLKRAETNVSLLNSESMELKEKAREAKQYQKKILDLNSKITSLQSQDTSPLLKKIDELSSQLKTKDDQLHSLQRKLDRVRRRSPLLQFSFHLSDIAKLTEHSESATVEDEFSRVQEKFEDHVFAAWRQHDREYGADRALTQASENLLVESFAHARLDAIAKFKESPSSPGISLAQFKDALKLRGFSFEKMDDGESYRIITESSRATSSRLGPFGSILSVLCASKIDPSMFSFGIEHVAPFISSKLLADSTRVATETERSRSSSPGGQAANVSETQITIRLFIDGKLMVTSESQDSRSALQNEESAKERLFGVKLATVNDRLFNSEKLHSLVDIERAFHVVLKDDKQTLLVKPDRWASIIGHWDLRQLDPIDASVIMTCKQLSSAKS